MFSTPPHPGGLQHPGRGLPIPADFISGKGETITSTAVMSQGLPLDQLQPAQPTGQVRGPNNGLICSVTVSLSNKV